jgi:hypothetical protein
MLTQIAQALAALLRPLQAALAEPSQLDRLLAAAGWVADEALADGAVEALATALGVSDDLDTLLELTDGEVSIEDALAAVTAGANVLQKLTELATADPAASAALLADTVEALPSPFDSPEIVLLAIADVGDVLLTDWLRAELSVVWAALRAVGVLSGSGPERVEWPLLVEACSDPAARLTATYGWGNALSLTAFDAAMRSLGALATRPLQVTAVDPVIAERYWGPGVAPPPGVHQYTLTLVEVATGEVTTLTADLALVVVPVPEIAASDREPTGLFVGPVARTAAAVPITFSETWSAVVTAGADLTGTVGFTVRPSANGGLVVAGETGAPALDLAVTLSAPDWSWTLGDPGSSRLEIDGIDIGIGLRDRDGEPEPYVSLSPPGGLHLTIAPPDFGGFLRLLIGNGIVLNVDTDIDISTSGLRVGGRIGFAITVLVNRTIVVLTIDTLDIALVAATDAVKLTATLTAGLTLGPIAVEVEGLGVSIILRPDTEGAGTFGQLDVGLELLPPTRLAASIESDIVRGSGFVDHDPLTGRYTGGLALDLLGVGISAITVVDTIIPGDPDGWALFASLGATFPSPIPIGFGFTLLGVGGVLALDRTMDAEALAAGLRNGVVDALLFPDDPLGDSATLLAQIDEYFPLRAGNTVIGPVVKIGWGSPTLITAQLGVVLSLPDGIIAVMGSVEALLPNPTAPLITLHMDSLGVIDIAAGTFSVVASLYDSKLLETIDLGGDMAMYLQVSGQPYFLLSVGGYHPGFEPPSLVPASMHDLRRMQASIAIASNVTVTVEAYFAVTSNSVQFGSSVNVVASVEIWPATYTAKGWFSFDVLLIFSPFKIVASMSAGVGIYSGDKELMGVQLSLQLEGPEPWYAAGNASFKFFGLKVDFELEVGSTAAGEPKPIVHPRDDVIAALQSPASWSETAPLDGLASGITYVAATPEDDTVWVRPDHQLTVRQSVAPLNRTLEIVGQALPAPGEELITVTDAGFDTIDVAWELTNDWFAPAQFEVLSRTDKLTRASFEEMTAGVTFGPPAVAIPSRDLMAEVSTAYESDMWEPDPAADFLAQSVRTGAAGVGLRHLVAPTSSPLFTIAPTAYTIVRSADGATAAGPLGDAGLPLGGVSQHDAMRARNLAIAADEAEATKLVLVPVTAALEPAL